MNQPQWCYKPVDVPNLLEIQKEFQTILPEIIDMNVRYKYFHVDRSDIESKVPAFVEFLTSINLLDRWNYVAIVATIGDEEFAIHVDAVDWTTRCYALNLPIINCHDSYTVWYDAEINLDPIPGDETTNRKLARFCNEETAKEIDRMPAETCAWINISIPHRPYTKHKELRAIVSARFLPEIHDYFI